MLASGKQENKNKDKNIKDEKVIFRSHDDGYRCNYFRWLWQFNPKG